MPAGAASITLPSIPAWRLAVAGCAMLLLGIGLARFGYTPLIPPLVHAGWMSAPAAAFLGATNLAGYLLGAALARQLRGNTRPTVRLALLAATLSFFACAIRLGLAWFFFWRLAAGMAGGVLMVAGAPAVLAAAPQAHRGRVAGITFTGVGAGIALAGSLVPWLAANGPRTAWLGFGAIGVVLTALAWNAVPAGMRPAPPARRKQARLWRPVLAYACCAIGFVPHTVFWVDFVVRGLGRGLGAGSALWVALGIAAACGPLATGLLAERIGFAAGFRVAVVLQAVAVALPLVATAQIGLYLSSIGVGALAIGVTSLASGRAGELAPDGGQQRMWGTMTIAYAVSYALGGYALSFVFARTGSYRLLFAIGAAALLLAWIIDASGGRRRFQTG